MVPKSTLREVIRELLEEYEIDNGDFGEDLLDRISTVVEVWDDEEDLEDSE